MIWYYVPVKPSYALPSISSTHPLIRISHRYSHIIFLPVSFSFLFNLLFFSVHIPYSNVLHTCATRLFHLLGICNHSQSVNDSDKYHISFTFTLYFQPVKKSTYFGSTSIISLGFRYGLCSLFNGRRFFSTAFQLNQPGKRQGTRLYSLFMSIFMFFWS